MGKREPRGMADVSVGSWGLKTWDQHSLPSPSLLSSLKRLSSQGQPGLERAPRRALITPPLKHLILDIEQINLFPG